MSSNETGTPPDPALRRVEAARDAVAEAIEDHFDRLAAVGGVAGPEFEADLRAAGRLMARNTRRQLAANLTLVRRLMEARSLPAMMRIQHDFLSRQAAWAMRDWERVGAQALDLLNEGRRGAGEKPGASGPEPDPRSAARPDAGPSRPNPS